MDQTFLRVKQYGLGAMVALALLAVSCSNDDKDEPAPPPPPPAYVPPVDLDDYRVYEGWGMRAQWGPYNLHDPSIEKDGDYYYVFSTDASIGDHHQKGTGHYMSRRSKDLVNWEFLGFALPSTPGWILDTLNNDRARRGLAPVPEKYLSDNNIKPVHWAPCARKVGDKFRLYYVCFLPGIPINYPNEKRYPSGQYDCWGEREFIGWAEASTLAGPWTDKGMVVASVPDGKIPVSRPDGSWESYYAYCALDPSFIIDPGTGKHWLFFGSWNSGIAAAELDPVTGRTIGDPFEFSTYKSIAKRGTSRYQNFEAPEITYNPATGFYYLFMAYDELHFAYNTRVARAQNIEGPYYGSDGGNVTNGAEAYPVLTHPYKFSGHGGWQGISHCAIFHDEATNRWVYNSQGHPSSTTDPIVPYNMVQHIHEVIWTSGEESAENNGWPLVLPERYAAVPQTTITADHIAGTWDVILLEYDPGKHDAAQKYIFGTDNTFRPMNAVNEGGSWTFDPQKQVLTITWSPSGEKDRLYVQDGLDWEASPRVPTLTFTGLTSRQSAAPGKKTNQLWGKRLLK